MCTGLEIAAIATAVGGTGAAASAQSSAKKQSARALNQQTGLSAEEFNRRTIDANDIFKENTDISRQTYDELNALSDDEFAQRTGLSKQAFSQLAQVDRDQVIRDAAASSANTAEIGANRVARDTARDAARAGYNTERDTARSEYQATLDAANAEQDKFRRQGDSIAAALTAAFGGGTMGARATEAEAARNALVASVQGAPVSPATVATDPTSRAIFDRYIKSGMAKAQAEGASGSKLASYTDAIGGGDRAINKGALDTAFVTDAAKRALAPLNSRLDVSSLKFNDAADRLAGVYDVTGANARDRNAVADANLDSALTISGARAAGETRGINAYTGAQDAALESFFSGRTNSTAGRGDTKINANAAKLQGGNSVSNNFENNLNNVTQYRMQNAGGGAMQTLSQLASAITPTLFSIGQRQQFAKANPTTTTPKAP